MGGKRRFHREIPRRRGEREARMLLGVLVKKRDAHLNADERKDRLDRLEEHRKRLIAMGFSAAALVHVSDDEQARNRAHGVADVYLEQTSRRFHGVPPDATDKKQGRKRKGGASPDPARYVPPQDN